MASESGHPDQFVTVETMVASRDKAPRVVLAIAAEGTEPTSLQLTPAKAREIGIMLIQASESATGESTLVRFLLQRLDIPDEMAGLILNDFRKIRGDLDREVEG